MKLTARLSLAKLVKPVLSDRRFLNRLEDRVSRIANFVETEMKNSGEDRPGMQLARKPGGFRIAPEDADAAWRAEYGTLGSDPRPWFAEFSSSLQSSLKRFLRQT